MKNAEHLFAGSRWSALSRCMGAGVIVCAAMTCRADSPQWRGADRNGKVSGFVAPKTWPTSLMEKWQLKVGASDATPALVDGRLYVFSREGAEEVTRCLDASTGKPIWESKYAPGVTVTGAPGSHPGPRSSPAVGDGRVVTLGVSGVLSCLDAKTGAVAWRKQSDKDLPSGWPRFFVASSPLLAGGMCIAQLGGPGHGAVVAFDLKSGQIKWKTEGDGPAYASPALLSADGVNQVVAQTEKDLIGLSLADGKQLWQVPTRAQRMAQNAVSPIINGSTVIFSGQGSGTRAIDISRQGDSWSAKELWSNPQVGSNFNTPVLRDDMLFGLSDRGNFFCLDAKTGKTQWTSPKKYGQRGFGSIIDAGSVLLALTNQSELIAFEPSAKEFTELATIPLSQAPTYAQPVISGNEIIIEDQSAVHAFTLQ